MKVFLSTLEIELIINEQIKKIGRAGYDYAMRIVK